MDLLLFVLVLALDQKDLLGEVESRRDQDKDNRKSEELERSLEKPLRTERRL